MPRRVAPWVVFTDLDGTLLDHETYRWDAAAPALDALRRLHIPLVIVTSKTWAEVRPLQRGLRRREPVIVENGGAIYVPQEYFPFWIENSAPAARGWLRVALGTPRQRLLRAIAGASQAAGVKVRSFAAMDVREIARRTGLPLTEARRAARREFDEPFVILDSDPRAPARLKDQIRRRGFALTRGSRFFHILGGNDKGEAVRKLTGWFHRALGAEARTMGFGDSPNDIPLLKAVDVPILVARPNGRYDAETWAAVPRLRRAGGIGPEGWNRALTKLLRRAEDRGSLLAL